MTVCSLQEMKSMTVCRLQEMKSTAASLLSDAVFDDGV